VDDDVDTVLAEVVALSVTQDSKALQLTAPSAREKRGKAASVVERIVRNEKRNKRERERGWTRDNS
jgi:hypothetical protein